VCAQNQRFTGAGGGEIFQHQFHTLLVLFAPPRAGLFFAAKIRFLPVKRNRLPRFCGQSPVAAEYIASSHILQRISKAANTVGMHCLLFKAAKKPGRQCQTLPRHRQRSGIAPHHVAGFAAVWRLRGDCRPGGCCSARPACGNRAQSGLHRTGRFRQKTKSLVLPQTVGHAGSYPMN